MTTRGWLRRAVVEAQNSAESLQATNETAGRLLDEGHDLRKQPATEPVSQFGEASAIAVIEAHALSGEPGLQQSILFAQKRDDVRLPTLEAKAASSNWNGSTVEVYAMPPIHLWDTTRSTAIIDCAAAPPRRQLPITSRSSALCSVSPQRSRIAKAAAGTSSASQLPCLTTRSDPEKFAPMVVGKSRLSVSEIGFKGDFVEAAGNQGSSR